MLIINLLMKILRFALIDLPIILIAATSFANMARSAPHQITQGTPKAELGNLLIRTVNKNINCGSKMVIPAGIVLEFTDGAKVLNSTGCTIEFQGIGLRNTESKIAAFSGFLPGDIVWTGDVYPSIISTSLWSAPDLSDKIKNAIAALAGKQNVTIKANPGNFGSPWQLKSGQNLYLTKGIYTNSINLSDGIEFFLESNTSVYGDGKNATILQESSRGNRNTRMFGPSGFKEGPFSGKNEKINLRDFAIEGHPSQVFFDNGPTTIQLGNCTDCHAVGIRLKDTHAYGIYVGGFRKLGFYAEDSSIEYCEFDHVIAQNSGALNGINIRIVHNKYWNLGKFATDPLSNAIDVEPNAEDEVTENIIVCDNQIDGRGAKQYWNGILVQTGGSKHGVNRGEICRNTILGRDLAIGSQGALLNGLMLAGVFDLNVHDNKVQGALQSGIYLNNGQNLDIENNTLTEVAPGGIFAVRVENVTDSRFVNNSIIKISRGNDDRFVEIGKSGNNIYTDNRRGSVVLLRGSRETNHQ